MTITGIDIVFIIVLLITVVRALVRGFVHEFMSMAAIILGIVTAVLLSGVVAVKIAPYIGNTTWTQVVAFLGLFLAVYIVVKIFESALNRLVERINLDSLDRALGFFLGMAEGLVLIFIIILIMRVQPFVDLTSVIDHSAFARVLLPLMPYASRMLKLSS
jgi:membrane protein required for colicin V production